MKIIRKVYGELLNNCYIVYDTENNEAYVIDPGFKASEIADTIKKRSLNLKGIILTHYHRDHTEACEELRTLTGASVMMHSADTQHYKGHVDIKLKDGDTFPLGNEFLHVVHTPGHSRGGICIINKESHDAFTGDTLFSTDTGYVTFTGGSGEEMIQSIKKIDEILSDDYMIWPGHEDNVSMSFVRQRNKEFKTYLSGSIPS